MLLDDAKYEHLGIELLLEGECYALYFVTSNNKTVREYLEKLKKDSIERHDALLARIERVSDRLYWSEPLVTRFKGVDELFEIRSPKDRIFFFKDKDLGLILLYGFKKQGNKTPRGYIENAERMKKEYMLSKEKKEEEDESC